MIYTGNEPIYPLNHRYKEYAENELGETLYSKTLREFMYAMVGNSELFNHVNFDIAGCVKKSHELTMAYIDQLNKQNQQS